MNSLPIEAGTVIIQDGGEPRGSRWLRFSSPLRIIKAGTSDEVMRALQEIEAVVETGRYAAGFVSYEAAPAFDSALTCRPLAGLPLLWFGVYESAENLGAFPKWPQETFEVGNWSTSTSAKAYAEAVDAIKQYIAAGDTYQVNYTIRSQATFSGNPLLFFSQLVANQKSRFAAYIDTGDHTICSASPELFFRLDGDTIECAPMKGTAARGLSAEEDKVRAIALRESAKDRAENIMIVDMVRNDLGRIADAGSVQAGDLYTIEKYKTLFQMTSIVKAKTSASYSEIFRALFPCASVTGAPKVRTMEIIRELEDTPRGVYTGTIGLVSPGRRAQFSVAIRTACIDRRTGIAEYGIGSGIVWDSNADNEHAECVTKALVLTARQESFRLIETMLWRPFTGVSLLSYHLDRLSASAFFFDFSCDRNAIEDELNRQTDGLPPRPHRMRLLLDVGGDITVEIAPVAQERHRPNWNVTLADEPIDATDVFLYHKTTRRDVYARHRKAHPECDDVILWNKDGEITESTICNVAARIDGEWRTPPVRCGLLAGTFRAALIERGRVREKVITKDELLSADRIVLMNAVRGLIPVRLA
ncbi:MAG: aminodeoxychorismate synthase component I [Verrucomicrobia bacterium]|nr:aminodeoxychorismate synthase component I [Verrucomicrobiota bacterium]